MLQFILMLLGLAFPSTDTNTVNSNDNTTVTSVQYVQASDASPDDTGGETQHIPPKK